MRPWSCLPRGSAALALLCAALLAPERATAAILGISYGNTLLGSHAGNLVQNGGFENGAPGFDQMWTGNGPYTGQNTGGPGVTIPSWSGSYPTGAYGWWGALPMSAAPCTEGANCVYFGNWITVPSLAPSFGANGVVTFGGPVTFTNVVTANQGQVTLSQTVALSPGDTYLLDFWTSGEGPPILPSGVFGLTIGTQSVFLEAVAGSRRYYVTFIADAASTTIAFTNWGHLALGQSITTELVLDDVILNAVQVPAPSGLAVLLPAAALLGTAAARRRAPGRA